MSASDGLDCFRFGHFTLNISSGALLRGETELKLRPKSYEVLRLLVENHGRLITKHELLDAVWGNVIVTDGSITQCLVEIRRALDDHEQKMVRTISRRGYIFDAPVARVREQACAPEMPESGDEKTTDVPATRQPKDLRSKENARDQNRKRVRLPGRAQTGLILTFGAAIAVAVSIFWWSSSTPDVPAAPGVAVLPLVNAGGDPEQQFFADGLSENDRSLSKFEGLNVMVAFLVKLATQRMERRHRRQMASPNGQRRVQRAGEPCASTPRYHGRWRTLWAEHYDRPYKDLFALQDEIAQAVAGALHARLLSADDAASQDDRPPSGSIDAYNAYLQGLKHWHDQDFPKAAGFMTRAVQLDPGYAMAWAHLSGSWSTVGTFWNEPPAAAREHMRESRVAADKALQLAPGLGAAHAARAYLQFYDFDDQGALAECRRAVQLAPRDGTVLNGCGQCGRDRKTG